MGTQKSTGRRILACFNVGENLRQLFVRKDVKRSYIIDGLRAFSILWLLAFHVLWVAGEFAERSEYVAFIHKSWLAPITQGHLGVDVFFVISGFLIGGLLVQEWDRTQRIDFKQFYYRRAIRLLPAYYFSLLVYGAIARENFHTLWANLLYVNNYIPAAEQFMGWAWSLAIEEQFYIVAPMVMLGVLRYPKSARYVFGALLGLSFVICFAAVSYFELTLPAAFTPSIDKHSFFVMLEGVYNKTHTRFGGLLIGVGVAYVAMRTPVLAVLEQKRQLRWGLFCASVGTMLFFLIATPFRQLPYSEAYSTIYLSTYRNVFALGLGGFILYLKTSAGNASLPGRFLSHPFWYPIAQLSYSTYLFHLVLIFIGYQMFWKAFPLNQISFSIYLLGLTVASLFVAGITWIFIENPAMKMRDMGKHRV